MITFSKEHQESLFRIALIKKTTVNIDSSSELTRARMVSSNTTVSNHYFIPITYTLIQTYTYLVSTCIRFCIVTNSPEGLHDKLIYCRTSTVCWHVIRWGHEYIHMRVHSERSYSSAVCWHPVTCEINSHQIAVDLKNESTTPNSVQYRPNMKGITCIKIILETSKETLDFYSSKFQERHSIWWTDLCPTQSSLLAENHLRCNICGVITTLHC